MPNTPKQRTLQGRIAAHTRWSQADPVEGTAKARKAALTRFEKQVDPDRLLDPAERERRADHAKKAYFLSLALKSAAARKRPTASDATRRPATSGTGEATPS